MIYEYRCSTCLEITTASRKMADRNNCPPCEHCGDDTRQIVSAAMLTPIIGGGDFPGYLCPETDEYVTSRKRRKEILKERDLVEK